METGKAQVYGTVTVDIVGSTEAYEATGQPLRPRLLEVVSAVNREFSASIAVPFAITLGDEFQGLVEDLPACPRIVHYLRLQLHPLRCRVGVGMGTVASARATSTSEMEGPAFSRSRVALDEAKNTNRLTRYRTGGDSLDVAANTISMLIDLIQAEWTDKQWEAVRAYAEHNSLAATGADLGISLQAVEQRLRTTHWSPVQEAIEDLSTLISRHDPYFK